MTRTERVERTKTVTVYLDPTCDKCEAPLTHVIPGPDSDEHRQYLDALNVVLQGGYGMHYDLTVRDLMLCGDCAKTLIAFLGIDDVDSE